MRAIFDSQDYMYILDPDQNELRKVRAERLEADLMGRPDEGELGKKAILEFGEVDHPDGIELEYLPLDHRNWDEIQVVHVTINERALEHVEERGSFSTRYNGLGDKIEIYNGLPGF